jgi:hypothetical protein
MLSAFMCASMTLRWSLADPPDQVSRGFIPAPAGRLTTCPLAFSPTASASAMARLATVPDRRDGLCHPANVSLRTTAFVRLGKRPAARH